MTENKIFWGYDPKNPHLKVGNCKPHTNIQCRILNETA